MLTEKQRKYCPACGADWSVLRQMLHSGYHSNDTWIAIALLRSCQDCRKGLGYNEKALPALLQVLRRCQFPETCTSVAATRLNIDGQWTPVCLYHELWIEDHRGEAANLKEGE